MKSELVKAMVEYIEHSSTLVNDLQKEAEDLREQVSSAQNTQFDKDTLVHTLEKCAEAGFINSKEVSVIAGKVSEEPEKILMELNKVAETVIQSRKNEKEEKSLPSLGSVAKKPSSAGTKRSKADEALLSRLNLT